MSLPVLHVRSFSSDQLQLDRVLYHNIYRVSESFKEKTIIDIGAGCGFFSFACVAAGANKVYAIEPYLDNYISLIKNIEPFRILDKVVPYQLAIVSPYSFTSSNSFIHFKKIKQQEKFFDFEIATETNNLIDDTYTVPSITLTSFLNSYIREKSIDLIKININQDIRNDLNSPLLNNVKNICGMNYCEESSMVGLQDDLKSIGFLDSYIEKIPKQDGKFIFFFSRGKISEFFDIKK